MLDYENKRNFKSQLENPTNKNSDKIETKPIENIIQNTQIEITPNQEIINQNKDFNQLIKDLQNITKEQEKEENSQIAIDKENIKNLNKIETAIDEIESKD
jgi:hypothetical protein